MVLVFPDTVIGFLQLIVLILMIALLVYSFTVERKRKKALVNLKTTVVKMNGEVSSEKIAEELHKQIKNTSRSRGVK